MNSNPLFSVIIPTYHRNDLLAKCLDCLAPGVQTLPADQYEVIVTDDGSQTTAEEMIKYHYSWAKWVAGPRKGPAANRNNGAKYAQGEWLVFTDDDCIPEQQWLKSYKEAVFTDIYVYEGKITCEAGLSSTLEHAPINLTGGYLWSCNMMVRKELFQLLRGFDDNFPYPHMEDVEFRERIYDLGYQFQFVTSAIVDHPPRKVPKGKQIAKLHESEIYFFCKRRLKVSNAAFLKYIIISRLKNIIKYSSIRDSFTAISSLIVEILYTVAKVNYWRNKYK